jgi:methyl-accepting chemotaxis protein
MIRWAVAPAGTAECRWNGQDDLPEGLDAVLDSVTDPATSHAATHPVTPVTTALPADVERRLAELVGIDPVVVEPDAEPVLDPTYDEATAADFARRVLRVAEQVTVGSLLLLVGCAIAATRIDSSSLRINPIPLTAWAVGAALAAVGLGALVTDPDIVDGLSAGKRRAFGPVLMAALLVAITGVVANADGVAAPAWVMFLPVVVVAGAVLGPARGLLVGALAAGGIYLAAAFSHTLDIAGLGRLVVILPAVPLFGWAAGALAGAAHDAVTSAREQRLALVHDVARLSELLESVSAGDLSQVPSLDTASDQATASLAVVFADTVLSLRRLVRQLVEVTGQLTDNTTQLAGTAADHVAAVEQQSSAVAETTSTIEELAATAMSIADTAERVASFAGATRRDVDLGAKSVEETTASMVAIGERIAELGARTGRLDERVAQIAAMTRLIDDMGRSTTMLGVNASIEAARVGGSGQGFGNVATEIGQLATKARDATAAIADIVTDLEQEVAATAAVSREGTAAVEAGLDRQRIVESALSHISSRVDDTTRAAHDITDATRQQRTASDAVVQAMRQVSSASHGATAATRSHAAAVERLRALMSTLLSAVARFRLD